MKVFITALIITLAACTFTACSTNTEYHVSTTGLDSNDGSKSNPFKTISAAAQIAQPGDVITVHEGVYRERVNPPRGGTSDNKRIVYQTAPGEKVEIRGSEVIKEWVPFKGTTWKVTINNSFFDKNNPYKNVISGDWFFDKGRIHHTGEVYLNGKSLWEMERLEKVVNPKPVEESYDPTGSTYTWFCESDENNTYIYANFHNFNPNKENVEINVREACFYPAKTGINYITVRGFIMTQAATPWAPPTAEQIGLIGTNWSKGWIIENNTISNSRCTGITLGKDSKSGNNVGDPADKGRVPDGVKLYTNIVDIVINNGWNKELIGSHIVRNNEIFDCGQAGICGSLGAIYSEISNNHIYNIYTKKQFNGFEMSGIKIHAAIDMIIKNNHIHNAYKGIWLDWMGQGTRISSNICYNNVSQDLFLEVNHGPILLDNNIFLSAFGIRNLSTGGAYAHNLVTGKTLFRKEERETPVFMPHSTKKIGLNEIPGGDDRCYNNIFAGEVLEKYENVNLPVFLNGNVYLNGAKPYKKELEHVEIKDFDPKVRLENEDGKLFLYITYDKTIYELNNELVTTELLGKTNITKQQFETTEGFPIQIDKDFFGEKRNNKNPVAGPFEINKTGEVKLQIR